MADKPKGNRVIHLQLIVDEIFMPTVEGGNVRKSNKFVLTILTGMKENVEAKLDPDV